MSLLLKALQRASKTRESLGDTTTLEIKPASARAAAAALASGTPPGQAAATDTDLDFLGRTRASQGSAGGDRISEALSAASADVATARKAKFSLAEWARENPVYAFAIAVVIFLVLYFAYVFVVIKYPALLTRSAFGTGGSEGKPVARLPIDPAASPAPGPSVAREGVAPAPMPSLDAPRPPPLPALRPEEKPVPLLPAEDGAVTLGPGKTSPGPAAAPGLTPAEPVSSLIPRGTPRPATPAPPGPDLTMAQAPRVVPQPQVAPAAVSAAIPRRPPRPTGAPQPRSPGAGLARSPAEDHVQVRMSETSGPAIAQQLDQAFAAAQRGDAAKAEGLYRSVLGRDSRNSDALVGLGNLAWQRGDPDAAASYYQRTLDIDPGNAAAQSGLIGLSGRADPLASESRLKQLISREPTAFLYASLGHLYAEQGQWSQAQQAYFQAFQLDSDNPDYAFNLAVGLEHLGQKKIALNYYRSALELAKRQGAAGFDRERVAARVGVLAEPVE